VGGSR